MIKRRILAFVLTLLMLISGVNDGHSRVFFSLSPFLQQAIADETDSSGDDASTITSPLLAVAGAECDSGETVTSLETQTGDATAADETESATADPTETVTQQATDTPAPTDTPTPTATQAPTPVETAVTEAVAPATATVAETTATVAPALTVTETFGDESAYNVNVSANAFAAGAVLVMQLEFDAGDSVWSPVPDPVTPEMSYRQTLVLDEAGMAAGTFALTGLSIYNTYRARITEVSLPANLEGWSASVRYTESQLSEILFETAVDYTLTSPTTTEPDAPAVTPSPTFAPDTAYSVQVSVDTLPVDGAKPLIVTLFTDAGDGAQTVGTLLLSPDENGVASGSFDLSGLSSALTYHATVTAYGDTALAFAYDEQYGAQVATLDSLLLIQTDAGHALSITVSSIAPESASVSMMSASFMPSALGDGTATPGPYDTALQFTMNFALNGTASVAIPVDFTLTENPDTSAYTATVDSFGDGLDSVDAAVSGNIATFTLHATVPGAALRFTLAVNALTLAYTLTSADATYDTAITGGSGAFVSSAGTADVTAVELTDYSYVVIWNDNKADDRPTPGYTLLANGVALDPQPTFSKNTMSISQDACVFTGLPKYSAGVEIPYTVEQAALSNYLSEWSGTTLTNTRSTTLHVNLAWNDASTAAVTRPDPTLVDFMTHFTFRRLAERATANIENLAMPAYTLTTVGDVWSIEIENLPSYDADGYPYDYMIEQADFATKDNTPGFGSYVNTVENVGVYAGLTVQHTAYDGGTLINTITDTVGFVFHNEWLDNNEVYPRPDVRYYLYRFPENSGLTYSSLSPVKGFDSMLLADKSTSVDVTYAQSASLPRYDREGNEYTYFIRATMPNPGDYKIYIDNGADSDTSTYLLPGGTATYVREATTTASYTKVWVAKAVQSMNGGITVQLEHKLSADSQSVWTGSESERRTLTGFQAETLTLTDSFTGLPKYTEDGAQISYRVREIGATLDASGGVPVDNIQADGTFTSGDYTFIVTQPADGDTANTIYNTITGTTQLRVRKVWNEALADNATGTIEVTVYQNGSSNWDSGAMVLGEGVTRVSGNLFTLTGTGNFEKLFENLPRYDDQGREYAYTVQENSVIEPAGYSLTNIVYSYSADGTTIATIYNTNQSGGTGLWFRVNKTWLDDGDLLQRVPVTFWLYFIGEDGVYTRVPDVSLTLSDADAWTGIMGFSPADGDGYPLDYTRYAVREVTAGSLTVADNETQTYLASGSTQAQTATQKYQVSTQKTGGSTYTVTNLRIGTVQITIHKNWKFEEFADVDPIATFGLYANGELLDDTRVIGMNTNTEPIVYGSDEPLPKYDASGVIIQYSVRELGVTDGLGGALALKIDETVLSSVTPGMYVKPTDLSLPDTMAYTFLNQLGGSGDISINVIWRDPGTGVPVRPDIQLQLYRSITQGNTGGVLLTNIRLWNTDHDSNSWYWTCNFGSYPTFDGNGNRYYYYVVQNYLQTTAYTASFYSAPDGVSSDIATGDTVDSTKETFAAREGEVSTPAYAYANFDASKTGVIINTLSGTQTIVRTKIWKNLPGWFKQSSLPPVYFKLFRTLTPLEEFREETTLYDTVQKDGSPWIEELDAGTKYAYFTNVPTYDIYGERYYYFVREVGDASGGLFNVDWYTTDEDKIKGTVTNTYSVSEEQVPTITVNIQKTWDFGTELLPADQTSYPATTYDLHQYWEELPGIHTTPLTYDAIVATATIATNTIASLSAGMVSTTITVDKNGNALPLHAADGQEYVYYIVERTLPGYTATYTDTVDNRSYVTFEAESTNGVAAVTNTYTPGTVTQLVATKVWDDQSNKYGTRPALADAGTAIAFTLQRKVGTDAAQDAPNVTQAVWTEDADTTANKWYCTFTGEFPRYTTLGQAYQYSVVETLSTAYATAYTQTAGSTAMQVINHLNTVNVQISKSWRSMHDLDTGELGHLLSEDELIDLAAIGAMPNSVFFDVEQYAEGNLLSTTSVEVSWSTLLNEALKGKRHVVLAGMPKYSIQNGSAVENEYRVTESRMLYGTDEKTPLQAGFNVTATYASTTITEIINEIAVQKLYFVKNWDDDINRDGVRPASINLTVTDNESGETTTVTLSPTTTSSDPNTEDPDRNTAVNRWRADITVPLGTLADQGYSVTENTAALEALGYSLVGGAPVTKSDVETYTTWWGFTNHRAIKVLSVKASKAWAGENNWESITRPATVTLRLLTRNEGETAWVWMGTGYDAALPLEGQTWSNAAIQWDNLPAYAPKTAYNDATTLREYRMVEDIVTGYDTTYDVELVSGSEAAMPTVHAITVTNTLQKISVSGSKIWSDVSNSYNTRPAFVTLTLKADGETLSDLLTPEWTIPDGNTWTYRYANLPKYKAGASVPIVYSVVETPAALDYLPLTATTATGTVQTDGNVTGANFTNTLSMVSVSGTKTWLDNSNHFKMRPATLTLKVLAGDELLANQPAPSINKTGDAWTYTFTNLPRYEAGTNTPITYSVVETAAAGYSPTTDSIATGTVNGSGIVTNANFTNTLITITLSGTKTWVDFANHYATRALPSALAFTLYENGTAMTVQPDFTWTGTGGDTWAFTCYNVPMYRKGTTTPAVYTLRETPVPGYTASPNTAIQGTADGNGNLTGFDYTNTLQTISLTGTKQWVDQKNRYHRRPTALDIRVKLGANTVTPYSEIIWSDIQTNTWTYRIDNLPRYLALTTTQANYAVLEETVPAYTATSGLTVTGTANADTGNITLNPLVNTLETVNITGQKVWQDQSNYYNTRPAAVTLTLTAEGETFDPLPQTEWDNTDTNTWSYTYKNLPRYQADNTTLMQYSVTETPVAGYALEGSATVIGTRDAADNITDADFMNQLITVDLEGSKTWLDNSNAFAMRPSTLTLTVYADGLAMAKQPTLNLETDGDVWAYSFLNLPRYQAGTADAILYSVKETTVGGYTAVTGDTAMGVVSETTGDITAADFTNELETITLSGTKTWVDFDNFYGIRPGTADFELTLLDAGSALTVQPTFQWQSETENEWAFTCINVPKYRKGTFTPAEYSIRETAVNGYALGTADTLTGTADSSGNLSGFDFTNTLETISIQGSKTWVEEGNLAYRPTELSLTVLDGMTPVTLYAAVTWEDTTTDEWHYTIENLPRYRASTGEAIAYTVQETCPLAYQATTGLRVYGDINNTSGNVTQADFVNTLSMITITGQKTWLDLLDAYKTRPATVTLTLSADGQPLSPMPTPVWSHTDTDTWTYTYTNLPRYSMDGTTQLTYTVTENPVAGYEAVGSNAVNGNADLDGNITDANFTNQLALVDIKGSKTWVDNGNLYNSRPDELTVTLLAGSTPLDPAPGINWILSGDVWHYTIPDVPRYVVGTTTPIDYSVQETAAYGYLSQTDLPVTGTLDGNTGMVTDADFTNTLETVTITGTKHWVDATDLYLRRPDSLTLTVWAGGYALNPQPNITWLQNGDDWAYTVTDLPRYLAGTATPVAYEVRETQADGYLATATAVTGTIDENGDVTGADFTNTLPVISITGTKTWQDQSNRYGTRPDTLTLTVKADGVELAPQPDVVWQKNSNVWSYEISGLPRYKEGSLSESVTYTVEETTPPDYTAVSDAPVYGTPDGDGNLTDANFENGLMTVTVSGTKIWDDQANANDIRPAAITLTVLADGQTMTVQPVLVWDKTTDADNWSYLAAGLPRYKAGTTTPVIYTVRETAVNGYTQADDTAGLADSATGDVTQADFTNSLTYMLEIDNTTVNAATDKTDAGGFVALAATKDSLRDRDPYQENAVSASWYAEDRWQAITQFTVSYLPHGANTTTGWKSVTVDYDGLSTLQSIPYFAKASLTQTNSVYTLSLTNDYHTMPYLTRILVSFKATLAVENLTAKHVGGLVSIHTENAVRDGRYPALIAYATAKAGYAADLNYLTLDVPTDDVVASITPKNAVLLALLPTAKADGASTSAKLTLDTNGYFSTSILADVGGAQHTIPITGKVTVLSLDAYQNPTEISVALDTLPISLDVGVRFTKAIAIPTTDDPILWVAGVFVLSGVMLLLLRRKHKHAVEHGKNDTR